MKTHEYDKTRWGDGPWMKEPDRVEWRHNDLPCLIVRNTMGALCGYVAVGPNHPLYGIGYTTCTIKCGEDYCSHSPDAILNLNAHGGITFADYCRADSSICHIPKPGEPDPVFWFGFDCAHSGDLVPALNKTYAECVLTLSRGFGYPDYYKDINYVKRRVEELAAQIEGLQGAKWKKLVLQSRFNVLKVSLQNWIRKCVGWIARTKQSDGAWF